MGALAFAGALGAGVPRGSLSAAAQQAPASNAEDNTGLDPFQPPPDSLQTMLAYQNKPNSTREITTNTLELTYIHSIQLAPLSILAIRGDLPFSGKNPINGSNPSGDFVYGISNADFQLTAIQSLNARWTIGFGTRVYVPTANANVGSTDWQIMPLGGFRYAIPEINAYFEPVVRYSRTLTDDPSDKGPSNLQFAPQFNVKLPDRWFVTFYPSADIRWDVGSFSTGQTGRLFLPFDARIGRKIAKNITASLEVGVPIVRDYPVYDLKTQFRLNVNF